MPAVFSVKLDDGEFRRQLQQMLAAGGDPRDYLKQLGTMMLRSVDRNFRARGRPSKWKGLSPYTIALREWRGVSDTTKILEVRGELRSHWEYRVRRAGKGQERLEIGSPTPHADVHQEGKTIPAPKRWKVRTTVKVPKRVLIVIHPEDWRQAKKFADSWLGGVV